MGERSPHLSGDEEFFGKRAEESESRFVFDDIANQRARHSAAGLRDEFVPVLPAAERAFSLDVGEMMVPLEFGDDRDPGCAEGQGGEHEE